MYGGEMHITSSSLTYFSPMHCKRKGIALLICVSSFVRATIATLPFCFVFQDIGEFLNTNAADLEDKLRKIGDSIVVKLVKWTRRLPFYDDLDVKVHTKLLTHKFHELVVLTTTAYQAIHGHMRMGTTRTDGEKVELHQEVTHIFIHIYVSKSSIDIYVTQ